jgi:predicted nucleic acid-binding protein
MSILLDTGILLRAFVKADPLNATICQAIAQYRRQGEELVTTFQNVAEFSNVSTRPVSARGGYGIPVAKVGLRVRFIERLCRKLFENERSYEIWRQLIDRYDVSGVAVHDARLVAIMQAHGVDRILTANERDFRRYEPEGIVIVTPQSVVDAG